MADHGRKAMGGVAVPAIAVFPDEQGTLESRAGTVAPLPLERRTLGAVPAGFVPDSSAARLLLFDDLPADQNPGDAERVLLVGLVWGNATLVGLETCAAGADLSLHRFPGLSSLPIPRTFPVVKHAGRGHVVTLPTALPAEVHRHGAVRELQQLCAAGQGRRVEAPFPGFAYALGNEDRLVAQVAPQLALVVRYVRAPTQVRGSFWRRFDGVFAAQLLAALALLAAFLFAVARSRGSELGWKAELPQVYAHYQVSPAPRPRPPAPAPEEHRKELSGAPEGQKSAGEEGTLGKPDAPQREAAPSKRGAPETDPRKKAELDLRRVKKLGLLAALGKVNVGGAGPDVLGPGGLGAGVQRTLGGAKGGGAAGDALGTNGLSSRGTGGGGGGHAIGIGGLGTRGEGHGRGGYGQVDLGGHGKDETVFVPGRTVVVGGLSRDVINRVIQRHYNEIKYCYEKELTRDPSLYGKISIAFVIDGGGAVADALVQQSTMGSEPVESCIVGHVRRWTFPQPEGGSTVQVTYPYVFKAGR